MGRVKVVAQRLLGLSLVGTVVGCGYVGYQGNAKEDAAAKQKRLSAQQERLRSLARDRVEKDVLEVTRLYDINTDDLLQKRDQFLKNRHQIQALSVKVQQAVNLEVKKFEMLEKTKEEFQQLASSLRQQKRALDAEVKELKKLVKIKDDLQARSTHTCSAAMEEDELQVLSSKVQERNRVLEAEIGELTRLVKVKEELQAKAEALDAPVLTHLNDPVLKKDDSVQS